MKLAEKKQTKEKGFTLVEVIIAVTILLVAIVPLMSTFVASSRVNLKGRHTEQAMLVAQNLVEGVKAVGANNSYLWGAHNITNYSILPEGSFSAKKAGIYGETYTYDLSNYTTADGTVLKDVEGLDENKLQNMSINLDSYVIKIDDIVMGSMEYDAYVFIKRTAEDKDSVAAYAFKDNFDKAGISLMEYYNITAYVGIDLDSLFTGEKLPDQDTSKTENMDYYIKKLEEKAMAKYTGTDISQTQLQ